LRIDAHQHFTSQHPPEHLKPILDRNRFEGSIVVDADPGEITPDFVKGIVRRVDWACLDDYQRNPLFRGVLHHFDDGIPPAFAELARRGLTVDLQMRPEQLPMLSRLAEAVPDLRMVIDDLANPPFGHPVTEQWARGMEEAARIPQVFCKASSLISHAPASWKLADIRPYVQHALRVFGPGRLMFGSGWPSCLPAAGWKETLAAFTQSIGAQTMEVREELLGGTAARFYGLADHTGSPA
jgi:L-fuconolactonase